jgi:Domain of unknown function (DUF4293)
MIQRQQTIWLLLSTIAGILSFMFPFVTGLEIITKNTTPALSLVTAGSNFFLLVLTPASIILSAVIIFLFKNRKQQMQLCLLGILLSVLIVVLYIVKMNSLIKPTLALSCIFPFAVIAGYYLAFRNIRKDEKLIKTLDKLR